MTREPKDWIEEMEVAGGELLTRIKELVKEGNVRRLVIRKPNGEVLLEAPLSAGLALGGVAALLAPILATLGAVAGLAAKFKVEVVRAEGKPEDAPPDEEEG